MSRTIEASVAPFMTSLPAAAEPQTSTALVTTSRFQAPPDLEPLPPGSGALVVVAPPQKRSWLDRLMGSTPRVEAPVDPLGNDARSMHGLAVGLKKVLGELHTALPHDAAILQRAPQSWEQLFTGYEVARASAIAVMAGMKVILDEVGRTGTVTAMAHSRQCYIQAVQAVKVADVECESLMPIARARHTEAREAADKAAKEAAAIEQAQIARREEIKDFTGARRANLVERIRQLHVGGYGFCQAPVNMPDRPAGSEYLGLPAEGVIPTMVLKGAVYFGKMNVHQQIYWDAAQPNPKIETLTELADIVDTLMGRDPTEHRPTSD